MTRDYARAPRGERAHGRVPRNRGTVTTMIGAMGLEGVRAMMIVEGATDGEVFESFVEHILVPKLKAGDIVCSGLRREAVRRRDPEGREAREDRRGELHVQAPRQHRAGAEGEPRDEGRRSGLRGRLLQEVTASARPRACGSLAGARLSITTPTQSSRFHAEASHSRCVRGRALVLRPCARPRGPPHPLRMRSASSTRPR
jgi:hypothetical protein